VEKTEGIALTCHCGKKIPNSNIQKNSKLQIPNFKEEEKAA
jgi:hypothetical protein